jgi:UDP-N-acetylmuramate dehydrogenase
VHSEYFLGSNLDVARVGCKVSDWTVGVVICARYAFSILGRTVGTLSEVIMQISYMQSLCKFNTYGVEVRADLLCKIDTCEELRKITTFARQGALKVLFLGGGSNVLLVQDFKGIVVLLEGFTDVFICSLGVRKLVRAGAGINWDSFVQFCADKGLQGLESLAGIPGKVGASPIQNIGAYGTEVGDCLAGVEVFDTQAGRRYWLPRAALGFAYRDSLFKSRSSQHLVILSVLFLLRERMVSTEVDSKIREELGNCPQGFTLPAIAAAVRRVRDRRLPKPYLLGNAGSFFVNPVVSEEQMTWMLTLYDQFPAFKQPDGRWKLSAGWLIQQCVAVGFRVNCVGIYELNPLVVINHGFATGADIVKFGQLLRYLVLAKFHVDLSREQILIK